MELVNTAVFEAAAITVCRFETYRPSQTWKIGGVGLTHHLGKVAALNRAREFESRIFRKKLSVDNFSCVVYNLNFWVVYE